MKTITLGQLKDLHAVGELGSFNSRIDGALIDQRTKHDDTEINFEAISYYNQSVWGMNDKQKELLIQWGIIEPSITK